ncbi:MAG TPA: winged helix-turn-helix domain-containing protein [Pyrinomonadaceae bacterium]
MKDGTIYEFSDFRLIPDEDLLLRDGQPVPLPPKAYATLALLIEHHGHLVKKSELMEKVWSDAFVEEAAVSKCVWTIRNALGEDSKSQRFIQTVPKRGYKFVADVTKRRDRVTGEQDMNGNGNRVYPYSESLPAGDVADSELPATPAADAGVGAFSSWNWKWYAVTAGVLAVALAVVLYLTSAGPSTLTGSGNRIAVLPLKPIDAANRSDTLEIGVADALINRLTLIKGLVVRPLSAIRSYTAIDQDPLAAGREQKVDHVIDSSYHLADGRIRITSRLINVASGEVEDSYKVETAAGDVFAVHDAVAADIGGKLVARFGATIGETRRRGTSNEEAYRNYLQGMFLYDQRIGAKAVEYLDRAVALDPNYGLAWAGKALAHRAVAIVRTADDRREYENSLQAVNRALALDPTLADAYTALCSNKLQYEYDVAAAEQACKHALVLEPNSPHALQMYATFLTTRGRHDEAIAMIKAAIDLEPSSFYSQRFYANSLYLGRRYDEARVQYLRLWERNRNNRATYEWMIRTLDASGQEAEAFKWYVELLRLDKVDEKEVERFQTIFRDAGWIGVLREREKREANEPNYFWRAGTNAQIGDLDRAFELLNKAYERRSGMMPILQVDPMLDPLRDDPRYAHLVRRFESK